MKIKYEMYQDLNLLIPDELVLFVPPAAEWQGNLYGVEGATEDDLPALNAIAEGAEVDETVKAATRYRISNIQCARGEILDVEDYDVVYDHLGKQFLAVSEFETEPVYIYWDGSNWKYVWLPKPDAIVEVEEDEDEEPYSLDTWDGNNYTFGGVGCHAEYYYIDRIDGEPVKDKVLLRYWSERDGVQPSGEIISPEKLEEIKAGE